VGITSQHSWLSKSQSKSDFCSCSPANQGVTRLYGARGKKQIWRPYGRIWALSKANLLYWRKYLWHCWDFSAPPAVIQRSHSELAPGELFPPCRPRYAPAANNLLLRARIFCVCQNGIKKEKLNQGCWSRKINFVYSRLDMAAWVHISNITRFTNGQWSMVYCFIWLSQQAEAS